MDEFRIRILINAHDYPSKVLIRKLLKIIGLAYAREKTLETYGTAFVNFPAMPRLHPGFPHTMGSSHDGALPLRRAL
ncbi:hypothetical protein V1498_13495 [Peribacillus sp. SCS-26]|uniref:hypothetical protein n=1 Tax=Paraperibacillus marinus TaxID=3115295 RepID=UPI003905B2CD